MAKTKRRATVLIRTLRSRRPVVHMLHIGKTGGTALMAKMQALNVDPDCPVHFLTHNHAVVLKDLPRRAQYIFAVRDPIARFRSGFYSRKREGRPRYYYPWMPGERAAFARFSEANDLAEALCDPGDAGARQAMRAIRHVNRPHLAWFGNDPALPLQIRPPAGILRQSLLEADFARLLARLGVPESAAKATLQQNEDAAHRTDYTGTPPLSEAGRAALTAWYESDIEFVDKAVRKAAEMP